jgi:hypothetical protein
LVLFPAQVFRGGRHPAHRFEVLENFYVRNTINRSLDVHLQVKSPGKGKEANWLLCPPSGPFNLTIRVYQSKQAMLDGTCKILPVRKSQ